MEKSTWTRIDAGAGTPLDLMAAHFVQHVFAPHEHDEFAIGVCTQGREAIRMGRRLVHSGPGDVVVIEPGQTHTGGAASHDGFTYRVLYASPSMLTSGELPHFPQPVVNDVELAAQLRRTHELITRWQDPLEAENRLSDVLAELVARHGTPRSPAPAVRSVDRLARHVKERLADALINPPSLGEVAAELGLSKFQVTRGFRQSVGMPPFAWLSQFRVGKARTMLAAGCPPAEVAVLVGFADQAHLTRWFRRVVGVTPAVYRNSVQDVHRPSP